MTIAVIQRILVIANSPRSLRGLPVACLTPGVPPAASCSTRHHKPAQARFTVATGPHLPIIKSGFCSLHLHRFRQGPQPGTLVLEEEHWAWRMVGWLPIPALLSDSAEPQFTYLLNGYNKACLIGLL